MIKTFPINSRSKTTALKQPKELYSYARDIDGEWQYDEALSKQQSLSYYYLPDSFVERQIDLGAGYSSFKRIPDEQNVASMPSLLHSLMLYEQKQGARTSGCDIVTFRGIMTKILTLPYQLKDSFDFYVVAYDGQIFIKNDDEADLKQKQQSQSQQQQQSQQQSQDPEYPARCEYSGYKFETVATLPQPWAQSSRASIDKRHKKLVNNYEQYISVVKTGVGKVGVMLAGEVDCVWDYVPDAQSQVSSHYVELKTAKVLEHPGQVKTFERKLFKTWAQSFLLGVRKVVYGFRDENLILRCVEVYKTDEIPLMIKENPLNQQQQQAQHSQKIVCVNALKWYGAVLEWLNDTVDKHDESKSYKLSYDSGSRSLSLIELDGEQNRKLRNGEMLTDEFKQWRSSLKQ